MDKSNVHIEEMVKHLPLGGHALQERAVAAALNSLLNMGRRGVVLADEVGFGKTYEALAIMAQLCDYCRANGRAFKRVLVLCKSSLLAKWLEEVSFARSDRGFPQYLVGSYWERHPVRTLLSSVHVVRRRYTADQLRADGLRGVRRDGHIQVPPGFYIVNHDVLGEKARGTRPLLRQLYRTHWDMIIVDEAHHYARWNKPAYIFAPDGDLANYKQGISDGRFRYILALTATPFELRPDEMVNLLALVRATPSDLEDIANALERYVQQLDRFFALRQRSPTDPLREAAVQCLQQLRDVDALGQGGSRKGLQELLRCYIVRNTKSQNERRYFLVNKANGTYQKEPFDKLDDLHEQIRCAPLLPFQGPDALFYLELRELIQATTATQADGGQDHRTFISNDLRECLSSYPQIAQSKLLTEGLKRKMPSAVRLHHLLKKWNGRKSTSRRLHPKVSALVDVVQAIAREEVEKVRTTPGSWFSKILVFNKMVRGTVGQLRTELMRGLVPIFQDCLHNLLDESGLGPVDVVQSRFSDQARLAVDRLRQRLCDSHGQPYLIPSTFEHKDLRKHVGRPLVDAFSELLIRRSRQPLFLLRAVVNGAASSDDEIAEWLSRSLIAPVETTIQRIAAESASSDEELGVEECNRLELAEQEAGFLLDECRSIDLVGRYDGMNTAEREAHRRNFNDFYNPFVLLVSRVGEEGIDLQKQCRYVVHYDLEWNPAKMEQREGRVDRVGWGRTNEEFIDVRFMLLKATYEERIFHTVMQRDQWFQILIGSKRRELGELDADEAADEEDAEKSIEETAERGRLTEDEKRKVMLDLRPAGGG